MAQDKKVEQITNMEDDFAQWYTDICRKAELVEYASVKGFTILRPYGYAIWENIQRIMDGEFKKTGHENVAMPVLIPREPAEEGGRAGQRLRARGGLGHDGRQREAGGAPGVPPHIRDHVLRPLAQCAPDLPPAPDALQPVVLRHPLGKDHAPVPAQPRVLVAGGPHHPRDRRGGPGRDRAAAQCYADFFENVLAIPVVPGRKTEKEKFAGAEATYTVECMMKDRKALQGATSHYFGDKFSRAYDVTFAGRDNKLQYPFQTSWGSTTRMIGAVIMTHGDNNGLCPAPAHRARAGGGHSHRGAQEA